MEHVERCHYLRPLRIPNILCLCPLHLVTIPNSVSHFALRLNVVALVLVMPITLYTTRCLTNLPLLKRRDPLATPLLAIVYFSIGLVETLPLICTGGSIRIFWGLWVPYSVASIAYTKQRMNGCRKRNGSVETIDQEVQSESSLASLLLGIYFPLLNGSLPFINMGLSYFLFNLVSNIVPCF